MNRRERKASERNIQPAGILLGLIGFIGLPLSLFLSAGRWDWAAAWIYIGVTLTSTILSRVLMGRRNPDLVRERAGSISAGNVAAWDRWIMPYVAVFGPLLVFVVAGLNERYHWAPELPFWTVIPGYLLILSGVVLATLAMLVNRFFSGTARIQAERGHRTVKDGPYKYIRHPGYLGGILGYLGMPLALESAWACLPAGLGIVVIVIRTALEDRLLKDELEGYADYTRSTRFRLFPGIW